MKMTELLFPSDGLKSAVKVSRYIWLGAGLGLEVKPGATQPGMVLEVKPGICLVWVWFDT